MKPLLAITMFCGALAAPASAITWTSIYHLDAGSPVNVTDAQAAHNGTNHSATAVTGQLNGAAGFTGGTNASATQYIDLGANFLTSATFTASASIYVTAFPTAGDVSTIISSGYDGSHTRWQLWVDSSNKFRCTGFDGASVVGATSTATLSLNTFTHVACTYSGGTWSIYINGSASGTGSATIPSGVGSNTLIGGNYNGGPTAGFNGRIDEVYLSDAAATPTEIGNLYALISGSLSISASPSSITQGTTGNVIALTGTGTSWVNGSTTFSLSGGTGASITAQSVASSTSGSITVTAGSAVGTLTVSENADAATGTITVAAGTTVIPVTDANFFFSPYTSESDGAASLGANNVRTDATYVIWNNMGGYFKAVFSGTSVTVGVAENSVAGGKYRFSIDNATWQSATLSGSDTSLALATGLSAGSHTLIFVLSAVNTTPDRWTSALPSQGLKITGLVLDFGSSLSSLSGEVAKLAKNALFFGDSITEGYATRGSGPLHDATVSWTYDVARGLGAEWGNVGFSGQGWTVAVGAANLPVFPSTWNLFQSGVTRLLSSKLSPVPDYIVINQGKNDGSTSLTNIVRPVLTAMRAAVNATTPIFLMVPFDGTERANITSEFNAQSDSHIYLIDLGNISMSGTRCTSDGTHPLADCNGWLATLVTQAIQAKLAVGAGSFPIGQ